MKNGTHTLPERILALLLCAIMVVGILPVPARAAEGISFAKSEVTLKYPEVSYSQDASYTGEETVSYSVSDGASVDEKGAVTVTKPGTYTITATAGEQTASYTLKVEKGTPELNLATTYYVGESVTPAFEGPNAPAVSAVTAEGAEVAEQKVTFNEAGTATVKVSTEGNDYWNAAADMTTTVTVSARSVSFGKTEESVAYNATKKIPATVNAPAGAKVTYSSSSNEIATVSADGTVKGIKPEEATITAAIDNGMGGTTTAEYTIKVTKADITALDPLDGNYYIGQTATVTAKGVAVTNVSATNDATVRGNEVTFNKNGNVVITADFEGNTYYNEKTGLTTSVEVGTPQVTLIGENGTKTYGDVAFNIVAENGVVPAGQALNCSSSNEEVATVDNSGTVTILKPGTTTIKVTVYGGNTAKYELKVDKAKAALTLSGSYYVGESVEVKAVGNDKAPEITVLDGTGYTHSDNTVTFTAEGDVTINARVKENAYYDGEDISQTVKGVKTPSVWFENTAPTEVSVGGTADVSAKYDAPAGTAVSYSISETTYASVDTTTGLVEGRKSGIDESPKVTVTATIDVNGTAYTANREITVKKGKLTTDDILVEDSQIPSLAGGEKFIVRDTPTVTLRASDIMFLAEISEGATCTATDPYYNNEYDLAFTKRGGYILTVTINPNAYYEDGTLEKNITVYDNPMYGDVAPSNGDIISGDSNGENVTISLSGTNKTNGDYVVSATVTPPADANLSENQDTTLSIDLTSWTTAGAGAANPGVKTVTRSYDWNGDGTPEQTITVTVDPEVITLKDADGNQVYPKVMSDFGFKETSVEVSFQEATYSQSVSNNIANAPVTYSVSGPATISGNKVTFTDDDKITVTAETGFHFPYAPAKASYTITVTAAEQGTLEVTGMPAGNEMTYGSNGNTITLGAVTTNGEGKEVTYTGETISYTVTDSEGNPTDVVSAEDNVLTIHKAGTVKITATKSAPGFDDKSSDAVTLTIHKAIQTIKLTDASIVYGQETYTQEADVSGAFGIGEITYTIGSEDNTLGVDSVVGGVVTLPSGKVGKVTIHAEKAADECYQAATASYILTVDYLAAPENAVTVAVLNENGWNTTGTVTITPAAGYTISESNATGAENNTWAPDLTYTGDQVNEKTVYLRNTDGSITDAIKVPVQIDTTGPDMTVTYDNNTAENGTFYRENRTATVKIVEANYTTAEPATVIVKKDGSDYTGCTITGRPNSEFTVAFTEDGDYEFEVRYADPAGNEVSHTDSFTIDKTHPKIEVSFDNNAPYKGNFFNEERKATITVTEHNLDTSAIKVTGNGTVSSWSQEGDVYTATVTFSGDGSYTFGVSCTDKAGNPNDAVDFDTDFIVDMSPPAAPVITFSDDANVVETILGWLGFYEKQVTVTITAQDSHSGIESITYSYTGTVGKDNATEKSQAEITETEYVKNGTFSFDIPADFKGTVTAKATNNAGLTSTENNGQFIIGSNGNIEGVVVDERDPDISATYSNNHKNHNGILYYSSEVEATFTVTENNFFEENFKVYLKKNNGEYELQKNVEWKTDGSNGTSVTAREILTEDINGDENNGDFFFKVTGRDYSSPEDDPIEYISPKIVMDVKKPEIEFPNGADHVYVSSETHEVVVKITEHNFTEDETTIKVKAENVAGVISDDYTGYTKVWTVDEDDADIHYLTLTFAEDAKYTVTVNNTDLAGNKAVEKTCSFTLDDTAPTQPVITLNGNSITNKILETLTFGFYKAPVKVTVESSDLTAGVKTITYSYTGYTGKDQAESVTETDTLPVNGANEIEFTIPAEFYGSFSAQATDYAANTSTAQAQAVNKEGTIDRVVVDMINPRRSVTYAPAVHTLDKDNNDVTTLAEDEEGTLYYGGDTTATITVTEENFYGDPELFKAWDNGAPLELNWKSTDDKAVWFAPLTVTVEGDHVLTAEGMDYSGNEMARYSSHKLVIDKTPPKISFPEDDTTQRIYHADTHTLTIQIDEHNFRADEVEVTVVAKDNAGKDIAVEDYAAQAKNRENWDSNGDFRTLELTFPVEANYTVTVDYTDLAGNPADAKTVEFTVDTSVPNVPEIKMEKPLIIKVIEALTFGFYQGDVDVTITATDDISGVASITYYYSGSAGRDNQTAIHQEKKTEDVDSFTFKLPSAFSGSITAYATDEAGNADEEGRSQTKIRSVDENGNISEIDVVVVDSTPPVMESVKYNYSRIVDVDEKGVKTDATAYDADKEQILYFNTDAHVDFTIVENNFFADDYHVFLTKRGVSEAEKSVTWSTDPELASSTARLTIPVTENEDHWVRVSGTDHSENEMTDYESHMLVVDNTPPTIEPSYDKTGNTFKDEEGKDRIYYKEDLTATITIKEHNFRADEVDVTVVAKDSKGQNVTPTRDYAAIAKDPTEWKHDGDVHTLELPFDVNANYTLTINYTDLATNKAETVTNWFTVDKDKPTGKIKVGENFWTALLEKLTFGIYSNDKLEVSGTFDDATSLPLEKDKIQYYIAKVDAVENTVDQLLLGAAETKDGLREVLKKVTDWTTFDGSVTIEEEQAFRVYFRVEDRAGNHEFFNTNGLIIDKTNPHFADDTIKPDVVLTLEGGKDTYGYYNTDVKVNVEVVDPTSGNTYSGLKDVTYKVTSADLGGKEKTENLFAFTNEKPTFADLEPKYTGSFVVDSSEFNANDVTVTVTAVDNAGNKAEATITLMIDVTVPQITVVYDNNDVANKTYFKADRRATITVRERNFDANATVVNITGGHGNAPDMSGWVETKAGGNGDDTTNVMTVTFSKDDDYTINEISTKDKAGNAYTATEKDFNGAAPLFFTIDQTAPTFTLTYDNNNASEPTYYNAPRTGTLTIHEHNFDAKDVKENIRGILNDGSAKTIELNNWRDNGDDNVTTISFHEDADYTISCEYTDLAGNPAKPLAEDSFTVDTKAPVITITGVENGASYRDSLMPTIVVRDHNFNGQKVSYNMTITDLMGERKADHKSNVSDFVDAVDDGYVIEYVELEPIRENDGLYKLTVRVTDRAGNTTEESLVYVVNRFGSIFYTEGETSTLLKNGYTKDAPEIRIVEINPNRLTSHNVTLTVSGNVYNLVEGVDYTVVENNTQYSWYEYIYIIKPSAFMEDGNVREGNYTIVVNSEDVALNKNSSSAYAATVANTEDEVTFALVIDRTLPDVVITGVENNEMYAEEERSIRVGFQDSNLTKVIVTLLDGDGNVLHTITLEGEELAALNGEYTFLANEMDDWQTVQVTAVDAAGNEYVHDGVRFYLNSNPLLRFYHNTPLFIGSIVVVLGLLILLIIFLRKRNKEEEEQTANV